jgi:hypothetical protein
MEVAEIIYRIFVVIRSRRGMAANKERKVNVNENKP